MRDLTNKVLILRGKYSTRQNIVNCTPAKIRLQVSLNLICTIQLDNNNTIAIYNVRQNTLGYIVTVNFSYCAQSNILSFIPNCSFLATSWISQFLRSPNYLPKTRLCFKKLPQLVWINTNFKSVRQIGTFNLNQI